MKQKRKVKNLIPCKNKDEKLLTILLLVLSVVLCLWSASLMTFSVWAAADDDNFYMPYTWYDDRAEVLYGLEFSDPNILWEDSLDKLYMEENSLYLSPSAVMVENNTGDSDKYVNMLWWESNEVYANNITIIAWYNNIIEEWNDNSSILWWESNVITWNSQKIPAVMVWWKLNKIVDNDGDVILWGSENVIINSSNSIVLWWEHNEIESGKNVVIWWAKVKVNGVENIFVFSDSDSDFQPESSDAFYLNLANGVWLSTNSEKKWVSISGAIWFGNIDIENVHCTDENIWVELARNGCLVWCTEESKNAWKWELLDRWSLCEESCNNDYCMYKVYTGLQEVPDYTGFCLTEHIDISNATRCTTWENESYENVVFEGTLIDYETECPITGNNKCVYRCNPETHLTWDTVWWTNAVMCYKDCELPWDHTKKIRHNETVIWYNIENVKCSNDIYVFPLETEIINKPVNIYSVRNKTVNGTIYKNRDKNGKSAETCGNYDHKKTLVCLSWSLYLLNNEGKADVSTKAEAEAYKYESCNLYNYRCDTWVYSLVQQQIVENKEDAPKDGNWVVADRWTMTWERWIYKLCVDYNADPTNPTVNWEFCVTGTTSYHYQFTNCQSWYDLQSDGVCRKRCTLVGINWNSSWYMHGTILTWYQATWAMCTGACQSQQIACNDGVWRLWGWYGEENTDYLYNDCELKNRVCNTGDYNVIESIKIEFGQYSMYDSCDPYDASGKFECVKKDTVYKLVGCEEWYHTENNKYCVPNQKEEDCAQITGKYDGNGMYISGKVDIYWEWGWNTWHWTSPSECEWKCDEWYHLEGNVCVPNVKIKPCLHGEKPENSQYVDSWVIVSWIDWSWTTPRACLWSCDDGYFDIDGECKDCYYENSIFDEEHRVCINDISCEYGFGPQCETNQSWVTTCRCVKLGYCLIPDRSFSYSNRKIEPLGVYMTFYSEHSRSMIFYNNTYDWRTKPFLEDREWECVDDASKIAPNSCQFACNEWFVCNKSSDFLKSTPWCVDVRMCKRANFHWYYTWANDGYPYVGHDYWVADWKMYYDSNVNYWSFDEGENLEWCATALDTSCYSLSWLWCAWSCQPGTILAKRVTNNTYNYSYDNYRDDWFCWKKCGENEYYDSNWLCKTCGSGYVPDTWLLIGPDVNGFWIEWTWNAVQCKNTQVQCPKYYNPDGNGECVRVECGSGEYLHGYTNHYSCTVCDDEGYWEYYLDEWNDEAGAYTKCKWTCDDWWGSNWSLFWWKLYYFDKETWECKFNACFYTPLNYYLDLWTKGCKECPDGTIQDDFSEYYNNYTRCRTLIICDDSEYLTKENGEWVCKPKVHDLNCIETYWTWWAMAEINWNTQCRRCVDLNLVWNDDSQTCV